MDGFAIISSAVGKKRGSDEHVFILPGISVLVGLKDANVFTYARYARINKLNAVRYRRPTRETQGWVRSQSLYTRPTHDC